MDAITIRGAAAPAEAQRITAAMYNDFISWIDRSESTSRAYITNLRQFAAWTLYTRCTQPSRSDIISYRDYLQTEHDAIQLDPDAPDGWSYRTDSAGNRQRITCKPTTVKAYMQSVKAFFNWTAASGLYPNVAQNVHSPKVKDAHRKDYLEPADVVSIERSIEANAARNAAQAAAAKKDTAGRTQRSTEQGKRLYAMYLLAVNAGLRTVEISRANVKDIEVRGGRAFLYVWGKGHAEADTRKALAPEVYAAILDYLSSRSDRPTGASPLFVSTGNRSKGKRIAPTTISTMLKHAMQDAGFNSERFTAHSLRHTAGQNIMEITDSNIYKTQLYMRHNSPKTTEIYLDNDKARDDAELAERLYQHYHNADQTAAAAGAVDAQPNIEAIIAALTPEQLQQLKGIAATMA